MSSKISSSNTGDNDSKKHLPLTEKLPLEFYKIIIENMKESLWVGDKDHKTLYVNPSFERIFGYKKEDWLGKHSYSYFNESNQKLLRDQNDQRIAGKYSVYEVDVLKKDGGAIPVLMSGAPLPNGGTVGIMADLSEIKESKKRYQKLVESISEGVLVIDVNDKITYSNPALLEMLGYALHEIVGQNLSFIFDEEAKNFITQIIKNLLKKNYYETSCRSKSGTSLPVLLHASHFVKGKLLTLTDLRFIKQLERSKIEFDLFTRYSADAMVNLDENDKILAWNVGAERMFGWKAKDVIGKILYEFMVPKEKLDSGEMGYLLKEANAKGFIRNHETVRLHKNGTPIDVSLTYTSFKDKRGKSMGYSAIYRDVTLQKQWQRDLEQRFDKLQNAYNEMGKLRRYIDYMVDLLDLAVTPTSHSDVCQFVVTAMIMVSHADTVTLRLFDHKENKLVLVTTAGNSTDWTSKGSISLKGSLAEKVFFDGKPLKILDVTQEPLYEAPGLARKNNLRSLLLIPLIYCDKPVGTISVYISAQKSLDILDHEFLPRFAKLAALIFSLTSCSRNLSS